jgi:molybdopterin synthase sulfur carrier subunit
MSAASCGKESAPTTEEGSSTSIQYSATQFHRRPFQVPVRVFLSSTLRRCIPGYDPSEGVLFSVDQKTTILDLCRLMQIPLNKIKIIMVNGRNASFDYELRGDERVGLFPPMGGG